MRGIAVRAHLVVRDDMPDEIAYAIAKTIAENFSRYPTVLKAMADASPEDMGRTWGSPSTPARSGARKNAAS